MEFPPPAVFTRQSLLELGASPSDVARRVRSGRWVRLLSGVYTTRETVEVARDDCDQRRRLLVAAADLRLGGVAAIGGTAAHLHDIPLLTERDEITVARASGRTGTLHTPLGDIVCRTLSVGGDELDRVAGLPCTSPARTVFDLARGDFEAGVVAADACLHRGTITVAALSDLLTRHPSGHGAPTVWRVMQFADGRAESPLESIVRIGFAEHGLPAPELQLPVYDEWQWLVARVDFGWAAHRTVAEADGLLKYRGDDTALVREKQRQERLEELGFQVVRVTWRQAQHERSRNADRVRAAFARSLRGW